MEPGGQVLHDADRLALVLDERPGADGREDHHDDGGHVGGAAQEAVCGDGCGGEMGWRFGGAGRGGGGRPGRKRERCVCINVSVAINTYVLVQARALGLPLLPERDPVDEGEAEAADEELPGVAGVVVVELMGERG